MMLTYSMDNASSVAKKAFEDIKNYLLSLPLTKGVENVEDDPSYRSKDIDLIWTQTDGKTVFVEIKGDRWHKTGNYFFETVSNKSKGTPGCFLYTEADFIYYYFVNEKELHILPMPETRNWFIENKDRFREKETSTPIGRDFYITVGRLVPRVVVNKEVKGIKIISL